MRHHSRLPVLLSLCLLLVFPHVSNAKVKDATPQSPTTYEGMIEAAIAARDKGDLNESVRLLKSAYKLEPSPELLNNLGRALEILGKYREAFETYRTVADDASADRSLRALDAGRMAALQPRINRAWLVPTITPEGVTVYLDGKAIPPTAEGGEHATGPATTNIEIHIPESDEIVWRQPAPPIGERSVYFEKSDEVKGSDARLSFSGIMPLPSEVKIDGQVLRGDLSTRPTVRLPAGEHTVSVAISGYEPESVTVNLEPEATVELKGLLAMKTAAATQEWKPTPMPWVLIGTGIGSIGAGAALMGVAVSQKDSIGAANTQSGIVETQTQSRANDLNDSAVTYGTAGTATLAVGAAAAISGIIWFFVHEGNRPADQKKKTYTTTSTNVSFQATPTPGGGAGALGFSF